MEKFEVRPSIYRMSSLDEFIKEFKLNGRDLIFTTTFSYRDYLKEKNLPCRFLICEDYSTGEPDDDMLAAILADFRKLDVNRVIGIGGGTVLDVAKLLCIKDATSAEEIYEDKIPLVRDKGLVLIPTTCGTGCEVTAVSVIGRPKYKAKIGKRIECNFADQAVLIPELLGKMPESVFAYSSIDALIHAMEIYVTPIGSEFSKVYCLEAVRIILKNYLVLAEKGLEARFDLMDEFLLASTYAGIALANDPCGAVHASAMHFGGEYHIPHGEANYRFLISVFTVYARLRPQGGRLETLAGVIKESLGIKENQGMVEIFAALGDLLNKICPRKALRDYGIAKEQLPYFVSKVYESQQRILRGNYIRMTEEEYLEIYKLAY